MDGPRPHPDSHTRPDGAPGDRHESADERTPGDPHATGRSRRRALVPWRSLVLVLVVLTSVVLTIVLALTRDEVPPSIQEADLPASVALVPETTQDERDVVLTARLGTAQQLTSPAQGVLTASSCAPGGDLASGDTSFSLDGKMLVTLYSPVPFWRDLRYGDEGADVEALQRELARLGHDVADSGVFDWDTWAAWDALVENLGGDTTKDTFSHTQVLWTPATTSTIAQCPLALGSAVTPGAALVALPAPLLGARVDQWPSDLVPGARVLQLDDATLRVDEGGGVAPEDLDALRATPTWAAHEADPKGSDLKARLRLDKALTVHPVPPGAVIVDEGSSDGAAAGTTGCVIDMDGTALSVRILASRLGRTYVAFESAPTVGVIKARVDGRTSCTSD